MRHLWCSPHRLLVASCLVLFVLAACDDATGPATGTAITSGFSFGECLGFCFQEVTVAGVNVSYVKRDYGSGETVEGDARLDIPEWQELVGTVDMQALMALPDVIGCPDCADGGAEWIEVGRDGVRKRVRFEFGANLPSIQPLLDAARAQRADILPR